MTIFRLVAAHTIEEIILARALAKLKLKHSVLDKGKFTLTSEEEEEEELAKDEDFKLTDVIKFGLKKIFENDESSITDDDIDTILKKGKVRLR